MDARCAIVVFRSEEDGAWIGDAPDLKSCSAHGGTPEVALSGLEIAVDAWLSIAEEKGLPIPVPRFRPQLDAAE